jgi:N-acyl-D-aspartate/D-glutamate deacylase
VFDPVGYTPRADYIRPREPSAGVSALFVNGKLALKDGAVTGAAAGRALLRPRPANCGE